MERVEPASTIYNDWTGTAAAENSIVNTSKDLYELAGLDSDKWTILGIDMHAFSHGEDPRWTVRVYAVDSQAEDVRSHDTLTALAERRGSVPVKDILLHDVSLDDVIRCMKVIHVQLRNPHFPELDIVGRGDHPVQE